jgi:hypothetical protein
MDTYCGEVRKLEKHFKGLEILHVVRDLNIAADVLAKLGSDKAQVPPGIFVEELTSPSIKQPEHVISDTPTPSVLRYWPLSHPRLKFSSITSKSTSCQQTKEKPPKSSRQTKDCGISIDYAFVAHPQANGQVERANGLILVRLKSRLYEDLKDYGSKWIDELPKRVWGYAPKSIGQQGIPLSSWYMALKLCC